MLPGFFVVGAQKCGTTSLHSYLRAHPDIYLPRQKETKFFIDNARFAKGLDFYRQEWFSEWHGEKAIGEVDPDYMYFDCALERMAESLDLNSTRFIFIFREPVSRAFSHYLMSYRRGLEKLSFEEALQAEEQRLQTDYISKLHMSYRDRGFYYRQVKRYLRYIDRDRMLFLLTEDLNDRRDEVLAECFRFLGVSADVELVFGQRLHTATAPKNIALARAIRSRGIHKSVLKLLLPFPGLRTKLRQSITAWNQTDRIPITLDEGGRAGLKKVYQVENEKLGELIGRDLSHWNN